MKTNLALLHVTALLALAGAWLLRFGASVAFAQQGKSRHDEPVDVVLARVPEKARAKRNPFESDPEAATAGKKLFGQHCAECHGEAADGGKRGPSLRVGQLQHATAGEIFWILTNGVVWHGMPAWSKLPEPQRWQIIAFLREFDSSSNSTGTNHPIHTAYKPQRTSKVQKLDPQHASELQENWREAFRDEPFASSLRGTYE
jgi:cytochrome c oxidase cbb3-type subunit 3